MHKRKLIREQIVSILKSNVTLVSSDYIFESRIEPIYESAKIPAIAVYTKEESSESFKDGGQIYQRDLQVAVEMLVQGNSNIDDSIDAICEEIESALCSDEHSVTENYQSIELTNTETAFLAEGRLPKAACRLTFLIRYETEH